jgi:hypothetical protein
MKKAILAGIALVSVVFLLSACSSGVSQEQYYKVTANLTFAQAQVQSLQTQVQSLQTDKTSLTKKSAAASAYAEFFDVLMYPAWKQVEITPRFTYASEDDYLTDLKKRASSIGDNNLTKYIQQLQQGGQTATTATYDLMNYCLSKIEENLK